METIRFDAMTSALAATRTRRGGLRFLTAGVFGAASLLALRQEETAARRRRRPRPRRPEPPRPRREESRPSPEGSPRPPKELQEICYPNRDICAAGLQCGVPTSRHTCSDTVAGIETWCCLAAGAECTTECGCCGNFYCSYDDNNVGHCEPNPEG
jgi:hypothetical protein